MPRHPGSRNHRGLPSAARRPRAASHIDRAAALRTLIQEGIVTAAALSARDDLGVAAMSMQRLGTLTSGMWRALGRELETAVERLDRQAAEHLDELQRRARALEVDADAVLAVGVAAGHLDEHRPTLEGLLQTLQEEARRLAAPDVLLGFSVDDAVLVEDEELEQDQFDKGDDDGVEGEAGVGDDIPGLASDVWLFVWPAPLSPARVRIVPELSAAAADTEPDVSSVSIGATADEALLNALSSTCGLEREHLLPALSALGLACWSAHQGDERGEDDDEDADDQADEADDVDTE